VISTSPSIGESNANAFDALSRMLTERDFNLRHPRVTPLQKALQAAGFRTVKTVIVILVTCEIEH
jgi:hypothetical protein